MSEIHTWQTSQWEMVCNAINSNSIPQTILLSGEEGSAIVEFAVQFAKLTLCKERDQSLPCDKCKSCNDIEKNTHPDLITLKSDGKISVDDVRHITNNIHLSSFYHSKRFIIIDSIDALTISSMNALLKVLEEPPEDLIFILLSYHRALIPETIRSRAKEIYFPPISTSEAMSYLKDNGLSDVEQKMYAFLSSNHPIKALEFYRDDIQTKFLNFLEITKNISKSNGMLEKQSDLNSYELLEIIIYLKLILEDIIRLAVGQLDETVREQSYLSTLETINKCLNIDRVYKVLDQLSRLYYENKLLNIKANKAICMDDIFIRLFYTKT